MDTPTTSEEASIATFPPVIAGAVTVSASTTTLCSTTIPNGSALRGACSCSCSALSDDGTLCGLKGPWAGVTVDGTGETWSLPWLRGGPFELMADTTESDLPSEEAESPPWEVDGSGGARVAWADAGAISEAMMPKEVGGLVVFGSAFCAELVSMAGGCSLTSGVWTGEGSASELRRLDIVDPGVGAEMSETMESEWCVLVWE